MHSTNPDNRMAVYLWCQSPFGYKVTMAAAHKGVHLTHKVATLADTQRAKKKTGLQKTPFVVVGDRFITDSTAICEWLDGLAPDAPALVPSDARDRAECKLLEDWADEALNKSVEPWLWIGGGRFPRMMALVLGEQRGFDRLLFGMVRGYIKRRFSVRVGFHGGIAATHAIVCAQLDLVEQRLQARGAPWLFGDAPTIADFAIAGQLANMFRLECAADLEARPALCAMVRRASAVLPWWTAR